MGSNDAVDVYQADSEKCCARSFVSSVDPALVASNLLVNVQNSKTSRHFLAGRFRPWYGSVKSVPLCFKFEPPNLSLHSDCTLNLLNDDKTKTLPSQSGYLPEFAPVYSGKSFVRYELKRKSYGENEFEETDDAKRSSYLQTPYSKDNKLPTQPKRNPTATVASGSCNENENKLLQDVDNPLSESHWCASPQICTKDRKIMDLTLPKFRETILDQVKEKYRVNDCQRGKWIISRGVVSLKENIVTVDQVWKKVCSLMREGRLPHCNGKFQAQLPAANCLRNEPLLIHLLLLTALALCNQTARKAQQEVWVYCDFRHSLKIRSTLEKTLGNIGPFSFCVHSVGTIMEL